MTTAAGQSPKEGEAAAKLIQGEMELLWVVDAPTSVQLEPELVERHMVSPGYQRSMEVTTSDPDASGSSAIPPKP